MRGSITRSLRTTEPAAFSAAVFGRDLCGPPALSPESLLVKAHANGVGGSVLAVAGIFLRFSSLTQFAVTVVNWLYDQTGCARPAAADGFLYKVFHTELRTLVVVPTMLTTPESVAELVEALEVRFLANRDEYCSLLSSVGFSRRRPENMPEDDNSSGVAQAGIADLNQQVQSPRKPILSSFFIAPRRWNARRAVCGWAMSASEAKLEELNSLLRGQPGDHFSHVVGRTSVLENVQYVITLDTDTQLPRDSFLSLWDNGSSAQPARLRTRQSSALPQGYGILQPRVAVSLPGTNHSRYARLWGGEPGIDPYTRAVSDVYQDVFGEGSFIGKGIYDVDVFEQAWAGVFLKIAFSVTIL